VPRHKSCPRGQLVLVSGFGVCCGAVLLEAVFVLSAALCAVCMPLQSAQADPAVMAANPNAIAIEANDLDTGSPPFVC